MGLCTVQNVRDAGLGSPGWDPSTYSDALIQRLIDSASQLIEERTGMFFSATAHTEWMQGGGRQMLGPIRPCLDSLTDCTISISSSSAFLSGSTDYTATQVGTDVEIVEKGGRKCQQFLRLKDSTSYMPGTWPLPVRMGDPNIKIYSPNFGWLDNSGSPTGQVPQPIEQLTIDLVADGLTKGYIGSSSSTTSSTGALKKEKIDVWENEFYESATETIARAIDDDWATMVWSAYTCPKAQVRSVPFGRG